MRLLLVMIYLWCSPVLAKIDASITLGSDYLVHGVSQIDTLPALQLSVEYTHDSNVYSGLWTSNNDFFKVAGLDTNAELNAYVGFRWAARKDVILDGGLTHYHFLRGINFTSLAYNELYFSITHEDRSVYKVACSPDFPGYIPRRSVNHCIAAFNYNLMPLFRTLRVYVEVDYSHSFSKRNNPWGGDLRESYGYWHVGIFISKAFGNYRYEFSLEDIWGNDSVKDDGLQSNFKMTYEF